MINGLSLNIVSFIGTHLLKNILRCYRFEDVFLGRLLDLAADQQLVEDEVGFLEVENDVELAHLRMDSWSARLSDGAFHKLTLPKYLSNSSTYRWMISSVSSSLSSCSTAQQKYKLAYLQRDFDERNGYTQSTRHTFCKQSCSLSTRGMSTSWVFSRGSS